MAKKNNIMKYLHKIQGASLVIAIVLLWYAPLLSHKTAMIVASIIIGINALVEVFN